jgi:hypothetical protein
MSSKKLSAKAIQVPVAREIESEQRIIVCALNLIHGRFENDYPSVLERTSLSLADLTSSLYSHMHNLSYEIEFEKIKDSQMLSAFPLSSNKYSQRVPKFMNFLKRFGKVKTSEYVYKSKDKETIGVFLKDNLIGLLGFFENPLEVQYSGYVPGIRYKKHLLIHHLDDIPGFSYVRLFCSNPGTSQQLREDNWKISFP